MEMDLSKSDSQGFTRHCISNAVYLREDKAVGMLAENMKDRKLEFLRQLS
jgi:hypothetical protein